MTAEQRFAMAQVERSPFAELRAGNLGVRLATTSGEISSRWRKGTMP